MTAMYPVGIEVTCGREFYLFNLVADMEMFWGVVYECASDINLRVRPSLLFFFCDLYQYIQQIVYTCIQWHVEECSVALLCN
jgi:hypothetical protein